ncbi:MAG: DUF4388 domain-containing protein [Nitrospirae bacterium]|nr:DUF4388 domain-containing protein [Nitrospirota bacterium]
MMTNSEIFSGKLQNVALTHLLQTLLSSKATGILTLQHDEQEKSIYVRGGNIIFASSNVPEDRLGNILVHSGKLTQAQVEAALKFKDATHKKFGAIIVELGYLAPKELFDGLKLQVKEIIHSLFCWDEGAYHFTPGNLPSQTIPLVLDPVQLISEIITRLQAESVDGP